MPERGLDGGRKRAFERQPSPAGAHVCESCVSQPFAALPGFLTPPPGHWTRSAHRGGCALSVVPPFFSFPFPLPARKTNTDPTFPAPRQSHHLPFTASAPGLPQRGRPSRKSVLGTAALLAAKVGWQACWPGRSVVLRRACVLGRWGRAHKQPVRPDSGGRQLPELNCSVSGMAHMLGSRDATVLPPGPPKWPVSICVEAGVTAGPSKASEARGHGEKACSEVQLFRTN